MDVQYCKISIISNFRHFTIAAFCFDDIIADSWHFFKQLPDAAAWNASGHNLALTLLSSSSQTSSVGGLWGTGHLSQHSFFDNIVLTKPRVVHRVIILLKYRVCPDFWLVLYIYSVVLHVYFVFTCLVGWGASPRYGFCNRGCSQQQ